MHDVTSSEFWVPHRVSYGETDAMGYLYYAEYLHLFERCRGEYIRALGMSYAEVEQRGIMLPVREAQCRYRRPAHYDALLFTHISIQTIGRASVSFMYAVFDADRKCLHAEGMTQHACTNREGRPVPMPAWFRALLLVQPVVAD